MADAVIEKNETVAPVEESVTSSVKEAVKEAAAALETNGDKPKNGNGVAPEENGVAEENGAAENGDSNVEDESEESNDASENGEAPAETNGCKRKSCGAEEDDTPTPEKKSKVAAEADEAPEEVAA